MPQRFHNNAQLKLFRKQNRSEATPAEALLWIGLKNKKLHGRKFRRQHSIGNYIVDFYCPSEKLIIELDGDGHFTSAGYEGDLERDKFLKKSGFKVLRFENCLVLDAVETVLEEIGKAFGIVGVDLVLGEQPPPAPPSQEGRL